MLLARLIALFGLPETATEDEVYSACEALKAPAAEMTAKAAAADAACSALGCATPELGAKVVASVTASGQRIIELERELETLRQGANVETAEALVASAIASKRLLPGQKAVALGILKADPAAGKAFIASLAPISAFGPDQAGARDIVHTPSIVANPEAAGVTPAEAAAAAAKRSR